MRALLLLLLASPLSAQVVVGVGEYRNAAVRLDIIEAFYRLPDVAGLSPAVTLSWDLAGDERPVLLPQLGATVTGPPVFVGFDVGASALPGSYTHLEPHVQARATAILTQRVTYTSIVSWQPRNGWARAFVAKLEVPLW